MLTRIAMGEELRWLRLAQGRTLRDVASRAAISLGYLSEVERGEKEASSEMIAAICEALEIGPGSLLRGVADRVDAENAATPVTLTPLRGESAGVGVRRQEAAAA